MHLCIMSGHGGGVTVYTRACAAQSPLSLPCLQLSLIPRQLNKDSSNECGVKRKVKGGREVADRLMQELEVRKERELPAGGSENSNQGTGAIASRMMNYV